jgi:hypothetical protein
VPRDHSIRASDRSKMRTAARHMDGARRATGRAGGPPAGGPKEVGGPIEVGGAGMDVIAT